MPPKRTKKDNEKANPKKARASPATSAKGISTPTEEDIGAKTIPPRTNTRAKNGASTTEPKAVTPEQKNTEEPADVDTTPKTVVTTQPKAVTETPTTPTKDPAATANTTPPKPKPRNPYKRYHVYTLCDGRLEAFDDLLTSTEFAEEYSQLIDNRQVFPTKAKMNAFLAAHKTSTPVKKEPNASPTAPVKMSPEDKTRLRSIKSMIEASKPHDTFYFYTKTTPKCKVVTIFMVAKSHYNEKVWYIKKQFATTLTMYYKNTPTENTFVNDLFTNIQTAKERDPSKGTNDAMVSVRASDKREFPQYHLWTWAKLPVEDFKTKKQEDTFIDENINTAMTCLRLSTRDPIWMDVVKEAYSERMFEQMMKESNYTASFPDFIQKCRIKVEPLQNMNTLVVLDEVKNIQLFMIKNEQSKRKYPITAERAKEIAEADIEEIADDDSTDSEHSAVVIKEEPAVEAQVLDDESEAEVDVEVVDKHN